MSAMVPAAMRRAPPYVCTWCLDTFATAEARDEHEQAKHLDDPDPRWLP